ncbi:hypothetical protein LEP1GSC041_2063 [Leptospira noguchii str. 2006001870]|nr:hypothetical protein LEP1GSC041_2063 [Leptospira noguchii str. 2006001870]EMS82680.1 hypothetical protein LEP1GSC073_3767 [Leptospira noguchii str. Cascata]
MILSCHFKIQIIYPFTQYKKKIVCFYFFKSHFKNILFLINRVIEKSHNDY